MLDQLLNVVQQQWPAIRGAPRSFIIAAAALALLACVPIWLFFGWRYDTRIGNLESSNTALQNTNGVLQSTIQLQTEKLSSFGKIAIAPAKPALDESKPIETSVTLQFDEDVSKLPKLVTSSNLWRWDLSYGGFYTKDTNNKNLANFFVYSIFLAFDKSIKVKTVEVIIPGQESTTAKNVTDYSDRTAMVQVIGNLAGKYVIIAVRN